LEFFILLVLPVLIDVLLIEIILIRRHKWGLDLLLPQLSPGEVLEPGMRLHLLRSILTQSIDRLPLNHLYFYIK
jgi:hypothetical protein